MNTSHFFIYLLFLKLSPIDLEIKKDSVVKFIVALEGVFFFFLNPTYWDLNINSKYTKMGSIGYAHARRTATSPPT